MSKSLKASFISHFEVGSKVVNPKTNKSAHVYNMISDDDIVSCDIIQSYDEISYDNTWYDMIRYDDIWSKNQETYFSTSGNSFSAVLGPGRQIALRRPLEAHFEQFWGLVAKSLSGDLWRFISSASVVSVVP